MRITKKAFNLMELTHWGYCTNCNEFTTQDPKIQTDKEDYLCPDCLNNTVKGLENALIDGDIKIK
jgi:hypothetical protein